MAEEEVDIRTYTGTEDLQFLFDYEAKYLFQGHFEARDSCDLVLLGNHTQVLHPEDRCNGTQTLLSIHFEEGREEECVISSWAGSLWRIVKELHTSEPFGHKLKAGDEVKLGRSVLKIKRLAAREELKQADFLQAPSLLPELESSAVAEDGLFHSPCRLCLNDENTAGDPLLHPCKCTGSLKYIHLSCIQDWIRTQVTMKERAGRPYCFSWKPMICEICHSHLPVILTVDGQNYDLFGVECMSLGAYIVVEETNESTMETMFHVAAFNEQGVLTIVLSP